MYFQRGTKRIQCTGTHGSAEQYPSKLNEILNVKGFFLFIIIFLFWYYFLSICAIIHFLLRLLCYVMV